MTTPNTNPQPPRPRIKLVPAAEMTPDVADVSLPTAAIATEQLIDGLFKVVKARGTEGLNDVLYEAQCRYSDDPLQPEWEQPLPLGQGSPLPEFPVDALPFVLGDYVREVAATVQVPPDVPAMMALAVLAAAGARRFEVGIGSQTEPLCLWTIAATEAGTRKSSVFGEMSFPLRRAERDLVAGTNEAVARATQLHQAHEERLRVLRRKISKATEETELRELETELAEAATKTPEIPPPSRLTTDDVTPERLATLMADNGGCMAIMSSEGGIFGMMAGRYNEKGGPNLDIYLKGHAGDAHLVDRAGGTTVYMPRTALTMGLYVQPDIVRDLGKHPVFRGRGLPARGLYALPESLLGKRTHQERYIKNLARENYGDAISRILKVPVPKTDDGEYGRHRLRISGDACEAWWPQADRVERDLGPDGPLHGIADWASKLAGQVARIAAGLHLVQERGELTEHPDVTRAEVEAAWCVGCYLEAHALAAFDLMAEPVEYKQAGRILAWVRRHRFQTFSRSECHQAMRRAGGIMKPDDLEAPLRVLEAHHYIVPRPAVLRNGGPGRPRSATYLVNPAVHGDG